MIAIVDYKAGNLRSVENALQRLGAAYQVTSDPEVITGASHVIMPGVGEASSAMENLQATGLVPVIKSLRQPVLGICIGLQLMCSYSEEGSVPCLGIFDAAVRRFQGQYVVDPIAGHGDCVRIVLQGADHLFLLAWGDPPKHIAGAHGLLESGGPGPQLADHGLRRHEHRP